MQPVFRTMRWSAAERDGNTRHRAGRVASPEPPLRSRWVHPLRDVVRLMLAR